MNGDKVFLYTCVDSFQSSATPQQSFLWPRAGVEPAFTRKHREYLRTCAYSVSNLWQFRESVIPHCWITYITHLPKSLGATLPFVHQVIWSGRQDSNLRPLVPKTSVLPTELLPDNCCFFIILRHSCPENSFRLLSRLTFTEGLHGSVHYHCGIAIAF